MRIIEEVSGNKYLLTGNKPYCIFELRDIDTLPISKDPRVIEQRLFYPGYNDNLRDQWYLRKNDLYNSGERRYQVEVHSYLEQVELFKLFKAWGFKVRHFFKDNELLPHKKGKFYAHPNITEEENIFVEHPYTAGFSFDFYLYKKDLPRFLKFLVVLSKKHRYKTSYVVSKGKMFEKRGRRTLIVK